MKSNLVQLVWALLLVPVLSVLAVHLRVDVTVVAAFADPVVFVALVMVALVKLSLPVRLAAAVVIVRIQPIHQLSMLPVAVEQPVHLIQRPLEYVKSWIHSA